MSIKATPAGVARGGMLLPEVSYRWRGTPGWNPASVLADLPPDPPKTVHPDRLKARALVLAEAQARRAEFARYRAEGWSVADATELVGVSVDTGRKYERRRKAEGGAGCSGC